MTILMLLFALQAHAQTTVGGSFDLYYGFNFNNPKPVEAPSDTQLTQPAAQNQYRVFDIYHDDMSLALVEAHVKHVKGPVAAYLAVGAGHTVDVLSPKDEVSKHVLEATVTFSPAQQPKWSFVAGKMTTHLGLEYTKTAQNWQYSRSVLFGYALPFWHTGVAATYAATDTLGASAFLYNETAGLYETNRGKTFGGQLKWRPREHSTYALNLLSGPEISSDGVTHVRRLYELTAAHRFNPSWSVAADVVFGQLTRAQESGSNAQWFAWTAAAKYDVNEWLYLSPRVEWYFDRSGDSVVAPNKALVPQTLDTWTLTAGADLGDGLKTKVEVRRDHSSQASFTRNGDKAADYQVTALASVLLDL